MQRREPQEHDPFDFTQGRQEWNGCTTLRILSLETWLKMGLCGGRVLL